MSCAVDANILLYASDEASPFHRPALELVKAMAAGPEIAYLFWPAVMAYLRISTQPAVFGRPLAAAEAIGNIEQLLGRPHLPSPGEQDGFWRRYREAVGDAITSGNLVPDAHLVALMLENDVRTIWTHDRDFRRFSLIEVRDPFP